MEAPAEATAGAAAVEVVVVGGAVAVVVAAMAAGTKKAYIVVLCDNGNYTKNAVKKAYKARVAEVWKNKKQRKDKDDDESR